MNLEHLFYFQNISLCQMLKQQIQGSLNQNSYIICLSKCRNAQPTVEIIQYIIKLISIQGQKWEDCLQRLSINNYGFTFQCSINNIQCYRTLLKNITLAELNQIQILQDKIQNMLTFYQSLNVNIDYIWDVYIQYLCKWSKNFQNRLQRIINIVKQRIKNSQFIYKYIPLKYLPKLLQSLCTIIEKLQKKTLINLTFLEFRKDMKNLSQYFLTKIYQLFDQLSNNSKIIYIFFNQNYCYNLTANQNNPKRSGEQNLYQLFQNQLRCISAISKTVLFYQFFINNLNKLITFFLKTPIITLRNSKSDFSSLVSLQDSLIYQESADDIEYYMQKLLNLLCQNVSNFLAQFINQNLLLSRTIKDKTQSFLQLEDMILKLSIIRQNLKQRYDLHGKIKQIIQNLLEFIKAQKQGNYTDYFTMKVVKLMYLYNNILPYQNFKTFHQIGFSLLFKSFTQTSKQIQECCQIQTQRIPVEVLFINILDQQLSQRNKNRTHSADNQCFRQLHQNSLWICEKIIFLIETFPGSNMLYILFNNLIHSFQSQINRINLKIIQFLIKQLQYNYQAMLKKAKKTSPQILKILDNLNRILEISEEQKYMQIEEKISPFLCVLKQPQNIQFQDQVLSILKILMSKSQSITPQLSKALIYTLQVFRKHNSSLNSLTDIIKQLCSQLFVKSIYRDDFEDLIIFFGSIISEYLQKVLNDSNYQQIFQTEWKQTAFIIQLFLQKYQQSVQSHQIFNQIYLKICGLFQSQAKYQIILTFHHICPKKFIIPNENFSIYSIKLRYTINLTQIMYVDSLLINYQSEKCFQILQSLLNFHKKIMINNYQIFQKTEFDDLPFGKIKVKDYVEQGLRQLKQRGQIDDMQYHLALNQLRAY